MFGYEVRAGANTRLQDREGEAVFEARGIPPSTYILPILGSSALRQRGAIFSVAASSWGRRWGETERQPGGGRRKSPIWAPPGQAATTGPSAVLVALSLIHRPCLLGSSGLRRRSTSLELAQDASQNLSRRHITVRIASVLAHLRCCQVLGTKSQEEHLRTGSGQSRSS